MNPPLCRLCGATLLSSLIDLGSMPLANAYVTPQQVAQGLDRAYPLHVRVCDSCRLVQADAAIDATAIFSDYAYFSSTSSSWVAHAARYSTTMIGRWELNPRSLVVEIASNDGYLLQHFCAAGIPVLGIEPAVNVAAAARQIGVRTEVAFFEADTANRLQQAYGRADLLVANNVLAHVPDIRHFIAGFGVLLQPQGVATFEFPHLLTLIEHVLFDTIYHEHYSYLSLAVVERALHEGGLRVFDVETLPTHGGSLRVFACHEAARHPAREGLHAVRAQETAAGLDQPHRYSAFAGQAEVVAREFQGFVERTRGAGRRLAAYGAAAKGNTLLNYCRIGTDDIVCVADACQAKQGKLLPGSHIPIVAPEALTAWQPDDVIILPWNIADEIAPALKPLHASGTRLWVAMPSLREITPGR